VTVEIAGTAGGDLCDAGHCLLSKRRRRRRIDPGATLWRIGHAAPQIVLTAAKFVDLCIAKRLKGFQVFAGRA
jgi:hypothetical protein